MRSLRSDINSEGVNGKKFSVCKLIEYQGKEVWGMFLNIKIRGLQSSISKLNIAMLLILEEHGLTHINEKQGSLGVECHTLLL